MKQATENMLHGPRIILESSVERVRVWACRVDWQGAMTRVAAPRKEEQRGQSARQALTRTRSGFTQMVSVIEGACVSVHQGSRRL